MAAVLNTGKCIHVPAATGRVTSSLGGYTVGVARLPTDPLFYADLTLNNIVAGSRYRVTRDDTGAQLATGVAASTTEIVSALPCYANPMKVNITVRNASGSPNYKVFDTSVYMVKGGAAAYILQQLDQ